MTRDGKGSAIIEDRPNRPLVVKCGHGGATRRITFPSAATCRLESIRTRVEECFALSASPFFLSYADDDGEEFPIRNESDLTEAIAYFISGDDDPSYSSYSGEAPPRALSIPAQKITLRVDVVVEYDGPSLSDTSSVASFRTGDGEAYDDASQSSWRSSGYTESFRDYGRGGLGAEVIDEEDEEPFSRRGDLERDLAESMRSMSVGGMSPPLYEQESSISHRRAGRIRPSSNHGSRTPRDDANSRNSGTDTPRMPPLTGPESDPAPSLLTHSELGSRWLREQSSLTRRSVGSSSRNQAPRNQYASDDESIGSDEELGDLALVRDARGKYYYSYQSTETSSMSSRSEADFDGDDLAPPTLTRAVSFPSSSSTSSSPPDTPQASVHSASPHIAEPSGPPILAPDCSACGIRLDYMRYVCQTCGEGDMWTENATGKRAFITPKLESNSSGRSEGSSADTDWTQIKSDSQSSDSQTVYDVRPRSGSMSTNLSGGSGLASSSASPTSSGLYDPLFNNDPLSSPSSPVTNGHHHHGPRPATPRGYELCVGCIELHGINHSKAAAKAAKNALREGDLRSRRRAKELRHTFREKIWGADGWTDVDYSDEAECTICRTLLFSNRFKCVSCAKFDLCRSCYQKVDEIHPAHTFLSIPDHTPPSSSSSRSDVTQRNADWRPATAPKPIRHPGAFCHNCLQDIVGPRFHCAVCPSWDLCIQCEGVAAGGDGSHTADHIMMKIPIPLASAEVELVSRRARDRWFQQDSTTVAASASPRLASSRSSSPTNETVYGGSVVPAANGVLAREANGRVPPPVLSITTRDALDHGARCSSCNEWIMGRRFQCANCPSEPEPYNLCSICELRSYRIHDPRHVFFKFDRPVHISLQSPRPFLPLLYKSKVGEVPSGAVVNPRDPTSYLKHVLHRETLCDIHSNQIRGIWLRCGHCAAGFDICQEAEQIADHDATHVFVVFKARVDMGAFRALADLAAQHSKPLLRKQVYVA